MKNAATKILSKTRKLETIYPQQEKILSRARAYRIFPVNFYFHQDFLQLQLEKKELLD